MCGFFLIIFCIWKSLNFEIQYVESLEQCNKYGLVTEKWSSDTRNSMVVPASPNIQAWLELFTYCMNFIGTDSVWAGLGSLLGSLTLPPERKIFAFILFFCLPRSTLLQSNTSLIVSFHVVLMGLSVTPGIAIPSRRMNMWQKLGHSDSLAPSLDA